MHDFQRDAQWATSQNPGLRLTGDSSLHECFGCHFIPAAFLFSRGSRKVVPVHDHLQLVVPGPAPAGVVVLAHNIRCQICLSQTAGLLQWLRSELDIFSCCPSSQCRALGNDIPTTKYVPCILYSPPSFLSALFPSALECSSRT